MLTILQIIVSLLLIGIILIQERSSGLSGVFGGSGEVYHKRRGFEKLVFWGTIALGSLFALLAILNLVVY